MWRLMLLSPFSVAAIVASVLVVLAVTEAWPCVPSDSSTPSIFQVYKTEMAGDVCQLHPMLQQSLMKNGFSQTMCPFGILIFGTNSYSAELLRYAANTVAHLVDSDQNGQADDEELLELLAHQGRRNRGTALVCGNTRQEERKEEKLKGLEGTFSCQTWKAKSGGRLADLHGILIEEAIHLVHQSGWAELYPDALGVDDFTSSIVARETARLQCTSPGWLHPENTCPDGAPFAMPGMVESPLDGTCNEPDCDIAEFYRQVLTLYLSENDEETTTDELDFWYSDHMPTTKAGLQEMVSDELWNVLTNPDYHQPQTPFTGAYTPPTMSTNDIVGTMMVDGAPEKTNSLVIDDNGCWDDPAFRWKNQKKRTCQWVARKKPGKKCRRSADAQESCASTCAAFASDGPNGEDACEIQNFSSAECEAVGCCFYDDGQCWSAVGRNPCKA